MAHSRTAPTTHSWSLFDAPLPQQTFNWLRGFDYLDAPTLHPRPSGDAIETFENLASYITCHNCQPQRVLMVRPCNKKAPGSCGTEGMTGYFFFGGCFLERSKTALDGYPAFLYSSLSGFFPYCDRGLGGLRLAMPLVPTSQQNRW